MVGETSIEFTEDELVAITELAGIGLPAGLGDMEDMPDEVRQFLNNRGRTSLEERGIIIDGTVNESVVDLLTVAAEPGIICSCAVEHDQIVDTTFLLAVPDLAVEHSAPAATVHRFTPFLPRDLMARLLRLVDLRPAQPAPVKGFSAPVLAVETASALALDSSLDDARAILIDAGVAEDSAAGFVESMRSRHSTALVTILHKPEAELVAGGQLTWIDCGLAGLWKIESPESDPTDFDDQDGTTMIDVEPVHAETLAAELLSYLPEAFEGPDTPPPAQDEDGPGSQPDEPSNSSN
jgi:hypothetical protein